MKQRIKTKSITIKKRKNFFPTLVINLLTWLAWIIIFLKTSPGSLISFFIFYLTLFLSIFLTFALILANSRRGFLFSTTACAYLALRQLNLVTILNLILLIGSVSSLEIYFSKK